MKFFYFNRLILCYLLSCFVLNLNYAQSPIDVHGLLQVQGNQIVDKTGNVTQLTGMSLFWSQWEGEFYNEGVLRTLRDDWNCNVVRAAMGVELGGYSENPATEKAKVMAVVDAAIALEMYVVIDFHTHYGEQYLDEAKTFFGEMAQLYGAYPNVIYEIYNEPLDVSWSNVIKPYAEEVIQVIRQYDSDNLIICGTRQWSQRTEEAADDPIDDVNVAYTLHFYAGTHSQAMRDEAIRAMNKGIALFVTEYGTVNANGDGAVAENETNLWWDFLDQYKLSHLNWSIADKAEGSAALYPNSDANGNWTTSNYTASGTFVRNKLLTYDSYTYDGTTPAQYEVVATAIGNGSITINPARELYDEGTIITLTAESDSGYYFSSWSGDTSSIENPLTLTVSSDLTINANFSEICPKIHELPVNLDASGTFQADSLTTNLGACVIQSTAQFVAKRIVRLNPGFHAQAGSEFIARIDSCGLLNPVSLSTSTIGSGTVNISPSGGVYEMGTTVNLTAVADNGFQFDNWSGDVSGTDANIAIIMDADKSITANFSAFDPNDPTCDNPTAVLLDFSYDGAGVFCWEIAETIDYINSWNTISVTINGEDYTNIWSNQMPDRINGKYYVSYEGMYPWSHFEANGINMNNYGESNLFANTEIKITPNPYSDVFLIQLPANTLVENITVLDQLGRIVEFTAVETSQQNVELGQQLSNGLYFLKISTNEGVVTQSVSKL